MQHLEIAFHLGIVAGTISIGAAMWLLLRGH